MLLEDDIKMRANSFYDLLVVFFVAFPTPQHEKSSTYKATQIHTRIIIRGIIEPRIIRAATGKVFYAEYYTNTYQSCQKGMKFGQIV